MQFFSFLKPKARRKARSVVRPLAYACAAAAWTLAIPPPSASAQTTYNWDRIGVGAGGFHTGMAFTPDGNNVYVRGDVFGLHRYDFDSSDPNGGRWHQVLDWLPTTSYGLQTVDGLATDPKNSSIVYALLGYAVSPTYTSPNDSHGLWVSNNKGAAGSWTQLLNVVVLGNNLHRNEGEPIAVDPFDDNVVYVGTRQNGLYVSTNARAASPSFTAVSSSIVPIGDIDTPHSSSNSDSDGVGIRSVVIDPNTSITVGSSTRAKNIYVNPHNSGIWRSSDGGQSWNQITATNTPVIAYRMVVLADGSLVVTGNTGLVRYSSGTNSWTDITPDNKGGGQGIGIEPVGRKRLVFGAISDDTSHPNPGSVYVTDDATAATPVWKASKLADGTLRLRIAQPWYDPNFFQTYADDFVFNPNNSKQVWFSDVYGVWKTDDITATNVIWTTRTEGLGSTVNHAMVAPPAPGPVLLDGVEDVGAFAISKPNAAPIDAITPNGNQYPHSFAYCEATPLNLAAYTNAGSGGNFRMAASNDGGATWRVVTTPIDGYYTDDYGVISMSSQNPNVAILNPGVVNIPNNSNHHPIYFTTNFQSASPTWYTCNTGPANGFANRDGIRIIAADKVNGNVFYATAETGPFAGQPSGGTQVWKGILNTSGGTPTLTWAVPAGQTFVGADSVYGPQIASGLYNNDVVTTPGKEGDVYIQTNSAGVYHSTDSGVTFNRVVGPGVGGARSISFDLGTPLPNTTVPTMYYAGNKDADGSYGIFRSTDSGANWTKLTSSTTFNAPNLTYILADRQQFGRVYVRAGSTSITYGEDAAYPGVKGADVVDDHTDPSGFLLGTNGSKTSLWGGVGYELYYRENMVGGAGQNVVYNYNGITGVKFDYSFGYLYDSSPTITLSASPTGAAGSWTTVTTATTPGGADGANQVYTVRASQPIPSGTNYIQIAISSTPYNSGALGTVSLAYTLGSQSGTGTPTTVTDPLNDASIASAISANIVFDSSNTNIFQGDTSRATRSVDTTQSITYHFSGITSFDVLAYSQASLGSLVTVSASPDNGNNYTTVATSLTNAAGTGGGWNVADIVPSGTVPTGTNYLKITLSPGSGHNWDPQISQVKITYTGTTPPPNTTVSNFSFETPSLGSGNYQYNPSGGSWTFMPQGNNAGSGITANGSPWGSPNAPDGTQVAFVQQGGAVSQSISGFATGTNYTITVQAAQRTSYNPGGNQSVDVYIDSTKVGTITPTSGAFASYTTPVFTVSSAGSHTLKFQGTSTGDSSLFLDKVVLTVTTPVNLTVPNFSFETPNLGSGNYQYNPSGGSWTFTPQGNNAGSGLSANGSPWGNPSAPDGTQVAFVQQGGAVSQSISGFATGTNYAVSVQAAQRTSYNPGGNQSVDVYIDSTKVGTITPTSGSFAAYTTPVFTVSSAGSHTLKFQGTNTSGDSSLFLDKIVVAPK